MKNFKLMIQYDGTRYRGWQRPQKDGYDKTISYKIVSALDRLTGEKIVLYGGARTEPGVHALAQTASFQTASDINAEDIRSSLNRYLPEDISILQCTQMPERFRADLNASARTYEYHLCTDRIYNVFSMAYTVHMYPAPDINAMQEAAAILMGKHDFRHLAGIRKKKGTEKEIFDISFSRPSAHPDTLIISITAGDFLYRMPLLITGLLLETGAHRRNPESIVSVLNGTEKAGAPADPKGLLLQKIHYMPISDGIL